MKHIKAYSMAFAISLAAASGVLAQTGGMKGMDMKASNAEKQTPVHRGSATVRGVDSAKGSVTLAHGPVKSLGWSAMTMAFPVKDKAMLDKIKPGAKVEFGFVQSGKEFVITEIKAQ